MTRPDTTDSSPLIGASINRTDGRQFVTGTARYVDDVNQQGQLYLALKRSIYSHAEIRSIDVSDALEMDGVRGIVTGADVRERTRRMPQWLQTKERSDQYAIAVDRVRYYGEPVTAVAAEDRYTAEDAVERISVEYEELEPVLDAHEAVQSDAPLVHPEMQDIDHVEGNTSETFHQEVGDVEAGFEEADYVFEGEFHAPAVNGAPMETHGCLAEFDRSNGSLTLHTSSQVIHQTRGTVAYVLGLPANRVRVVVPEVGGGFGNKGNVYAHEICAALLSEETGRPVKAKLSRQEQLEITTAGFEYDMSARLGVRADGTITAWEEDILHNEGAYHSCGNAILGTVAVSRMLPYKVSNISLDAKVVYTNRVPGRPYRGTGMRQLALAREALLTEAADELGLDPIELRMRNVITNDECPYETAYGAIVDSSGVADAFERAKEMVDYEATKERVADEKLVGIGVSTAMHLTSCRHAGHDRDFSTVKLRLEPDGSLTLQTDACDMGTGCRTTLTQIVADQFDVGLDQVNIVDGDTDRTPYGMGSWGSRTLALSGSAAYESAERMKETLKRIAAEELEASVEDVTLADGEARIVGTDVGISLGELSAMTLHHASRLPADMSTGQLSEEVSFETGSSDLETPTHTLDEHGTGNLSLTYPTSCQIAVVSVDPDTGKVTVEDYAICDDAGKAVNPEIVEGQAMGGAVQAVGTTFAEQLKVDSSTGQPTNTSFSDYKLPTASTVSEIQTDYVEIPSPNTPGGWKGVGEGALVAGPAALLNAVRDATGVPFSELPLTPDRVKTALSRDS